MWLSNVVRILVVVGALLLIAACGGSRETNNANYVAIPTPPAPSGIIAGSSTTADAQLVDETVQLAAPTVIVTTSAAKQSSNISAETFNSLESAYDHFLAIRSSVIVGQADINELNDISTSAARDQVAALREINDDYLSTEAIIAMTDLMEWSNIVAPVSEGDRVTFTDCTERQYVTRLGARRITFATNDVVMIATVDSYQVESVTERQNGAFATVVGEQGCVPASFGERADTTVTAAITELATLVADPATGKQASALFGGELRPAITSMVEELADNNLRRVSDETFELSIVGMDLGKPEFTVIVAMCTHYPTGYFYIDGASGQRTAPEILPGSSEHSLVYVQLNPGVGADAGDVVTWIEPQATTCPEA